MCRKLRSDSLLLSAALLGIGLLQTLAFAPSARADVGQTGPGVGVVTTETEGQCGTLYFNSDGTYENAFAIRNGLLEPPYGQFAECYAVDGAVCAVVLDLTNTGNTPTDDKYIDIYVWEGGGENPGAVRCLETGFVPGPIGLWPEISRHEFVLTEPCCVAGDWWAGFYSDWGTESQPFWWYIGADLDGAGGCPRLNIAPGEGYPSGWQNPSVIWGPDQALGIGVEVSDCPTPVEKTSWGRIKSLF